MSSNRTAIAAEIQAALTQHGTLTSSELVDCCPSAEDREIISKVIYQLKTSGIIEKAGTVPGAPGRGAKHVSQWRLSVAAHEPIEEIPMPSIHMKFPAESRFDAPGNDYMAHWTPAAATEDDIRRWTEPCPTTADPDHDTTADPTEEALADLVDQADEAVLALADSLLSDHPVWSRLRALQSDAFQALCSYRLRSYLASDDRSSHAAHEIQEMQK